jgi:hypothetical protein
MALGVKHIETRSWPLLIGYRGPLAIHATAKWERSVVDWLEGRSGGQGAAAAVLYNLQAENCHDWRTLPLGCVVCVVDVLGVRRTEDLLAIISPEELAFGDYRPGRYGIVTRDPRPFDPPIPARGARGIWHWDGFDATRFDGTRREATRREEI